MNAAIYARVSTAQQAEHGYSLQTQIELCRKKAVEMGVNSTKVYCDDGYSGAYLERPALDHLRDNLALFDVVIVYDTDRLARNVMHLLLITEEIEKHCQLVFVNTEYSQTPESRLFFQIKGSFAEYERIKITDRMNRGKRGKLQKGLPVQNAHIYGYNFIDGQYVINDAQAETVRLIFDLYAHSTHSIPTITRLLNERGITTLTGRKWTQDGVHTILRREHYSGTYCANTKIAKKTGPGKTTIKPRDKKEWIKMSIPAIIEKDTFDRVQEKLTRNRTQKIRQTKNDYLLQGILFCGNCGKKIVLHHANTGHERYYDWYKCNSSRRHASCGARFMRPEITDRLVWEAIKQICSSETELKRYINQDIKDDTPEILKKLEKIKEKQDAIISWFDSGLISEEKGTEKLKALKMQEENLKSQLKNEKTPVNTAKIVEQIKKGDVQPSERRNILLQVVDKITIQRMGTENKTHDLKFHIFFK